MLLRPRLRKRAGLRNSLRQRGTGRALDGGLDRQSNSLRQ